MTPTIFAVSTPQGVSAISIIRISGPESFKAADKLFRLDKSVSLEMRKTYLRKVFSKTGRLLDECLVIFFEKGKSFTGENMVELHLHGSHIVVKTVLESLSELNYLKQAEAGEFTKKALENNKLNLFEVEGLSDLLVAETEAQQKQALNTYSGVMSKKIEGWKNIITKMLSLVEASIDFSEEVNNNDIVNSIRPYLKDLQKELNSEKDGFKAAESIRDGFEVAFVGKPNVGKSTILNRLARRNLSITSEISGTTRDIIELRFNLNGIPITFLDTAGIRYTKNKIEKIGVSNTIDRVNNSDIRVFLTENKEEIKSYGVNFLDSDLIIRPKGDIFGSEPSISGKTGKGFDFLLERLKVNFQKKIKQASLISRTRHLEKVVWSLKHLKKIATHMDNDCFEIEIIAEEFRNILRNFDGLLGLVDTEDILGEIFSNFCIGK